MGSQTVLIFCVALSAVQIVCGEVWQFGVDNNPAAVIVSNYQGEFTLLEKVKNVKLIVPPCYQISYVRVDVNNGIASPAVYLNTQTNVVSIQYALWQLSSSNFSIIGKAVYIPGCYVQPQVQPQQHQILPNAGR